MSPYSRNRKIGRKKPRHERGASQLLVRDGRGWPLALRICSVVTLGREYTNKGLEMTPVMDSLAKKQNPEA